MTILPDEIGSQHGARWRVRQPRPVPPPRSSLGGTEPRLNVLAAKGRRGWITGADLPEAISGADLPEAISGADLPAKSQSGAIASDCFLKYKASGRMPGQGRLGDRANVALDAHGCPACPHPRNRTSDPRLARRAGQQAASAAGRRSGDSCSVLR